LGRNKKRKKHAAKKRAKKRAKAASAPSAAPAAVAETTAVEAAPTASTAGVEAEATAPADAPPATSPPRAEPAESVAARPDEPIEDLDTDLDDGDASYDSLVALVASMPDEDAAAGSPTEVSPRADRKAGEAEDIEVVDLDDASAGESVERLIAKAVVGAPVEESEEEQDAPLIDLDVDAPPPSVDRAAVAGRTPTAGQEAARLALAAARGGVDDDKVTSFSVDEDEESTPEARARLLAQALAHAEHQEARYRVPIDTGVTRRWKALAASAVFVLAGWVAAAPPGWVRPEPPARLNATARARNIRTALLLQAQQVEAFRVEEQRLPTSLDELPRRLPGIEYARSGNRAYQLVGREPNGAAVIYDSADPSPAFRPLIDAWSSPEAAP